MISSILLTGAMILGNFDGDGARSGPSDQVAYKSSAAEVGRDPNAHIRLALWCEAHGLSAERVKHLSLAVLYDPKNSLARGLLGLVAYQGKWKRPEQVARAAQEDPDRTAKVKEYLERRARTHDRAADQWKLALWCEENGLKPQANAHLYQVVRLDPSREAAWKRLGFTKLGGHWDKPERLAAVKAEAQRQHKANDHWRALLEESYKDLSGRNKTKRAEAEKSLSQVTDPRAVPSIWAVFVRGEPARQKIAVKLLGHVDSPGSSRALAVLAVMSPAAEVRQHAIQTLRRRDPRDFAPLLVGMLEDPIKYEVRKVDGPGSQGVVMIKNSEANVKRLYSPPPTPSITVQPGDSMVTDAEGLPVINRVTPFRDSNPFGIWLSPHTSIATIEAMFGLNMPPSANNTTNPILDSGIPSAVAEKLASLMPPSPHPTSPRITESGGPQYLPIWVTVSGYKEARIPIGQMTLEAQRAAEAARRQQAEDVQAIDAYNTTIREANQNVRQVLSGAVGTDLGADCASWEKWVTDLSGYAHISPAKIDDKPTYEEEVPLDYQPQPVAIIMGPPQDTTIYIARMHNCFAAGTPVQTMDGLRPIEKLRVGDQVLSQDPNSGELKYQPLLAVYHNPPNETLRIGLDNDKETIVATGIHRLWKAGKGWTMARELKPGDPLRTLAGIAVVKSIDKDRVQPVFNMRVADGESFFVGNQGVLAHDNSRVDPTPSPFDAVPDLRATARP